ncbi:Histone-lysine N-methyltransferase, H3 lysine-36 and H4 lysine-20 specific [Porphyridium purpureum]|uniref:Histone-lysine N-methyltransferase, H3 lysine-36 and H4 lysine-20 specific n=1 Tax=Porphyridium purpureum TaxID=35688 RepID=A0A5J4YKY1_PORPP|nr:Histone-lysine N-methyltransferase, H3 lysine-36 and H4 lysine-20 specific [Porphyridium purpureum]|eukprot:POR0370..scf297_16
MASSDAESTESINIDLVDDVCAACEKPGTKLYICEGGCNRAWHRECIAMPAETIKKLDELDKFVCAECENKSWSCWFCRQPATPGGEGLVACADQTCGKHYHRECLRNLPLTRNRDGPAGMVCPRHVCPTCDLNVLNGGNGVFCLRCPVAYHSHECAPPGCVFVDFAESGPTKHFRCAKHHFRSLLPGKQVKLPRCAKCGDGESSDKGKIMYCDGCPAGFHATEACAGRFSLALQHKISREGRTLSYCESCLAGRMPRVGDLVWVKMRSSPFWPARVRASDDPQIPLEMLERKHDPWELCIQWLPFASQQWSWMSNRVVAPYEQQRFDLKEKHWFAAWREAEKQLANEKPEAQKAVAGGKSTTDATRKVRAGRKRLKANAPSPSSPSTHQKKRPTRQSITDPTSQALMDEVALVDTTCAVCRQDSSQGIMFVCPVNGCDLAYHEICTGVFVHEVKARGSMWRCPRHQCAVCLSDEVVRDCSHCPYSYCAECAMANMAVGMRMDTPATKMRRGDMSVRRRLSLSTAARLFFFTIETGFLAPPVGDTGDMRSPSSTGFRSLSVELISSREFESGCAGLRMITSSSFSGTLRLMLDEHFCMGRAALD